MRCLVLTLIAVLGGSAAAQEVGAWRDMSGEEIDVALRERVLDYGAQWQDFRNSGRTLYFSGREAWGYWEVRGDAYCSQWPPSDLWACYSMQTDGVRLRFVADGGEVPEAIYKQ